MGSPLEWLLAAAASAWYGPPKPCGCYSDDYHPGSRHPSEATRIGDHCVKRVEERPACTITRWVEVLEFRCHDCGEQYEVNTGISLERTIEWDDGMVAEVDEKEVYDGA